MWSKDGNSAMRGFCETPKVCTVKGMSSDAFEWGRGDVRREVVPRLFSRSWRLRKPISHRLCLQQDNDRCGRDRRATTELQE
jgi:hypothetical protein